MPDLERATKFDKNLAAILGIEPEKLFAEPKEKLSPFYCMNCGFPLNIDEVYDAGIWQPGAKQSIVYNCIYCHNPTQASQG